MALMPIPRPRVRVFMLLLSVWLVIGCTSVDDEWKTAKSQNTLEAYKDFLQKYPDSKFTSEASELNRDLTPVRGRLYALVPSPMGGGFAFKLQGRGPASHFSLFSLEGQAGDFDVEFTSDTQFFGPDKRPDASKMVSSGDEYEITGKRKAKPGCSEARIIEARTVVHLGSGQDQTKQ
jgi:hypothetical protein